MILTNHEDMENTDSKTGMWLGEFTEPYYDFYDAGFDITLANPKDGEPPIDPLSELTKNITSSNRRFRKDLEAMEKLKNTIPLYQINPSDFDGLFIPGGHGPMWDLATDETSGRIILGFLNGHIPVATVCHGPAALIKAAEL